MARTASAKKKLPLPSLVGSVAHKPLWLPASSSVCSLLALFSESLESSLNGAPALYCFKCYFKKSLKKEEKAFVAAVHTMPFDRVRGDK
jgi:hypothetical protein